MKKHALVFLLIQLTGYIQGFTMPIKKAIIPAAGLGTRFLPITKATPKEMLPIVNKPAIDYIVKEGVGSGITHFTFITSKTKQAIPTYFEQNKQLEQLLAKDNKKKLLGEIQEINNLVAQTTFTYINQPVQLGVGHAISLAQKDIGNEFFGIFLPDDIIYNPTNPGMKQLIEVAAKHNASVIAVQEVPKEALSAYGVVRIKKQIDENTFEISGVVEKPKPEDAPSNLAVIGRYVFSPKLFESLKAVNPEQGGELPDAITHMIEHGEKVLVYKFDGTRFDLGTPPGWLKANSFFAKEAGFN